VCDERERKRRERERESEGTEREGEERGGGEREKEASGRGERIEEAVTAVTAQLCSRTQGLITLSRLADFFSSTTVRLHLVVSLQLNAACKIFIYPSGLFVADRKKTFSSDQQLPGCM
jgi:hypothetical protein